MDQKHTCQHCGGRMAYPSEQAGTNIACPHCGKQLTLGTASEHLPRPVETTLVIQTPLVSVRPSVKGRSVLGWLKSNKRLVGAVAGVAIAALSLFGFLAFRPLKIDGRIYVVTNDNQVRNLPNAPVVVLDEVTMKAWIRIVNETGLVTVEGGKRKFAKVFANYQTASAKEKELRSRVNTLAKESKAGEARYSELFKGYQPVITSINSLYSGVLAKQIESGGGTSFQNKAYDNAVQAFQDTFPWYWEGRVYPEKQAEAFIGGAFGSILVQTANSAVTNANINYRRLYATYQRNDGVIPGIEATGDKDNATKARNAVLKLTELATSASNMWEKVQATVSERAALVKSFRDMEAAYRIAKETKSNHSTLEHKVDDLRAELDKIENTYNKQLGGLPELALKELMSKVDGKNGKLVTWSASADVEGRFSFTLPRSRKYHIFVETSHLSKTLHFYKQIDLSSSSHEPLQINQTDSVSLPEDFPKFGFDVAKLHFPRDDYFTDAVAEVVAEAMNKANK